MKPEPHGAISSTLSFLHNTDAMDWTFEGRRAVIHLNDKMMASLKPRGLIGYRRQEGSYEGKGLEIIARSGAVAWKEVMTSEHGVEPIRWI
ncbi:MAG: hypothetical protein WCK39_11235, partial [Methanomassiliicoccales archaeon]